MQNTVDELVLDSLQPSQQDHHPARTLSIIYDHRPLHGPDARKDDTIHVVDRP